MQKIELQKDRQYTVGTVTYQVTAFFNEKGSTLKDVISKILKRLIVKSS